jgi:reactive intermediate/imine deaminase
MRAGTLRDGRCCKNKKVFMRGVFIGLALVCQLAILNAQIQPVLPKNGAPLAGPYTPGVFAGDYLYVSGQGDRTADGREAATFDAQAEQTFENIKGIVESAGLTMDHVVYTQVYLADMKNFDAMNRAYAKYFPKAPPASACLGVAALHGTSIEINAVAVRDLSEKKAVVVPGYKLDEPISAGILTRDRLFVSAMRGRNLATGDVPPNAADQVNSALDGVEAVLKAAGLGMKNMVSTNPYLTKAIPMSTMNELYAKRFEFGNTPARATIKVSSLPGGAQIEYTGVAVCDLSARQAVRPKNMPPSPTASPCVFAGDTLYCSGKGGFIPGPNSGIFVAGVDQQLRQTMRNLLDNLEEAGMDFSSVVSTTVYLDDLADFPVMNKLYAKYFKGVAPARTTVQQLPPVERKPNAEGEYPELEQISLIAVRKK